MGSSPYTCTHSRCERRRYQHQETCIFHSAVAAKNPREFQDDLAVQITTWRDAKADIWDFSGWVFTDVDWRQVLGGALAFEVRVNFSEATFGQDANFSGAEFEHEADFKKTSFWKKANFDGVRFQRSANFAHAKFTHDANFKGVTFTQDVDFSLVSFDQRADFAGATFKQRACFPRAAFSQSANFENSIFALKADFMDTRFLANADFSEVSFQQKADFFHVRFGQIAHFHGAIFSQDTSFGGVRFVQDAHFVMAVFEHGADFSGTTFDQVANFFETIFREGGNFAYATFTQSLDITQAAVHGWLQLRRLSFPQRSGYWPMKFDKIDFGKSGTLDLRDNDLQEHNLVIIRDCNLGRILLSNTDFEHMRLYVGDGDFETTGDKFLSGLCRPERRCTGDEWVRTPKGAHTVGDPPTWNDVELTYQELARVFRESFNHPVANDCERGFFEARRNGERKKGGLRGWCNYFLISVYKYASYYSDWMWLPVLWLLAGTFLVFPGLYDLTLLRRNLVFMPPARYWPSLEAMIASLRVAALDRAWLSRKMLGDGIAAAIPKGDQFWVSVFAVVQLVATAALIALFILALRRRFKHGD
jgi:uncharacterized protein YjbI with pentapeptide repeats